MNRHRDDSGASLVLALVIVTVISVVVAVVLSFTDTNLRATLAVRDQARAAASADGAGQIAVNTLRRGTFDGTLGQCFGLLPAADTLTLTNFYQSGPSAPDSAAVTCQADTTLASLSTVAITPLNRPANAVLTMSTAAGEDGLRVDVADGRTVAVHGSVFANSTVTVPHGGLSTDAALTARGACTGTITSSPPMVCGIGPVVDPRGDDPNYPAPVASTTIQTVPVCVVRNQLVTFTPGRYTDITGLNNLTRCQDSIFSFQPGTYYFDFPDTIPWLIDHDYIVGGTPTTPLVAGTPPSIPGSCLSPVPPVPLPPLGWTPPPANSGVQFVFGAGAQIVLRSTQMELCGSYSATSPPVAVYGLKSAVGPVAAENGCTVATPFPGSGCAVLTAESTSRLYVAGTTYLPRAALTVALNNPGGQAFGAGVIARSLTLTPTVTADLTTPVIGVPDYVSLGRRTVVYLNVYLCAGSSSCTPATGRLRLRAKVGIADPAAIPVPGARAITIYSWSVQR